MNKKKFDRQQIYRMWQEGYSIDYITLKIGAKSRDHIREIIKNKFGLVEDKRIDSGKIFALRNAGWPIARIADEMQIPFAEVTKILIGEIKP